MHITKARMEAPGGFVVHYKSSGFASVWLAKRESRPACIYLVIYVNMVQLTVLNYVPYLREVLKRAERPISAWVG